MKQAGPERDREIAELRGEEFHHVTACHSGRTCRGCDTRIPAFQSGPHPCDKKEKPYSTDITCAMELWEEMRGANIQATIIWRKSDNKVSCHVTNEKASMGCGFSFKGETEADAISGAWLKWKRGNDG